jgi:geranylgeranyl reductase family protein
MIYDVVIVGGGPAGSSAARKCSQLGMTVLLIDMAVFPREKLCGGAVSEQAIFYLDFDLPQEIIEREIYGARIHFKDLTAKVRKPYRIAVLVSRSVFDHYLLNKAKEAGSHIIEGLPAKGLDISEDHVAVLTGKGQYKSQIVIGCDGFYSTVAKYVRRPHQKKEYGICMEASIPTSETDIENHNHDAVDIYFNVADKGYGWVFPHRGYYSTGIGGIANRIGNPKPIMEDFLLCTGFSNNIKAKGFPIPAGGIKRKLISDRLVLAGDAAGFVDSFSGEGIAYAIRSGQIAAETAAIAIRKGNCRASGLVSYVKSCEKEITSRLRYS